MTLPHRFSALLIHAHAAGWAVRNATQVSGGNGFTIAMAPTPPPTGIVFEMTRGTTGANASLTVAAATAPVRLQVAINAVGQIQTCRPGDSSRSGDAAC